MASGTEAGIATALPDHVENALALKRRLQDVEEKHKTERHIVVSAEKQNDLLQVLRSNLTYPAFLDHEFSRPSPEHAPKKARLSAPQQKTTIATKLESTAYQHFSDIKNDAAQVREELTAQVRRVDGDAHAVRPSVQDLKQLQRIQASEQLLQDMLVREELDVDTQEEDKPEVKQEHDANDFISAQERDQLGTVLTLFGNAPTPKQLFSSLQTTFVGGQAARVKPELPIEEMSLPIGLAATKIQASRAAKQAKAPTFADAFPPSLSLPQLSSPKVQKRPSTRDSAILWEFKESLSKGSKRGGYTTQPLTVASWLSYGGEDALSPREKRKQRERALSSSAGEEAASRKADFLADLEKQEEVLFKKAYSSYAPAFDNSRSLVDASLKNLVWWRKIGSKRFDARFGHDPVLVDLASKRSSFPAEIKNEDDDFSRVVEEYDESMLDLQEEKYDATNVDQVLKKISELIETLASHQRIRNVTLTPTSTTRAPMSPSAALAAVNGRTNEPSEDEKQVYEGLRRDITYLILQLPPYAVAKLDGDQLAELEVSKILPFESDNYKGQMDEDQVARMSRYQAAATAAGIASLNRSSTSTNPHYSSSARAPAIGQSANTRYGQSTSYGSNRTPMTNTTTQRPPSGQGNYSTPTGMSRSTYSQPNQYARAGASQSYGQSNAQQYYQRPQTQSSGSSGYVSQYAQNNQNLQRPTYASTAQQQLQQQRAQMSNQSAYTSNASDGSTGVNGEGLANGSLNVRSSTEQPGSRTGTPLSHPSPAHTPVNGLLAARAPPPLIPRASSGTPNPQQGSTNLNGVAQ